MNNQKVVISFEKITQQAPEVVYQQRYYAATSTRAGQRGTPEARCVYLGQLRPAAGAQSPFVPPWGAQLYLFTHFHLDSWAEFTEASSPFRDTWLRPAAPRGGLLGDTPTPHFFLRTRRAQGLNPLLGQQ